ncbi:thioesterase family protein [Haloimpatiens massiliensis]|uniref:thioesterase family protein n=1 Tax=Haloimpatiens massiliensis TaxID=1658110 RepID=UPI000C840729|nr:thioesterase family protein [Haloimpatiens massiliensis]
MNFSTLLKVGETVVNEYIVKPENTADVIGNTGVNVLSTPSMIGFMENTSANVVMDKMPENYRVVGTKINVEHINSTPINMKVTVKSTLTSIEGKKLCYNVEAFNEKSKIGFGTYEQHIINLESFLDKN